MREDTRKSVIALAETAGVMAEKLRTTVFAGGLEQKEREMIGDAIAMASGMRARLERALKEDCTVFEVMPNGEVRCMKCMERVEGPESESLLPINFCPQCGRRRKGLE